MNMLVSFTKDKDIQYHYFTNCKEYISFISDDIYKLFISKGYTWSAIQFPEELANKCMFTQSICNE